MSKKYTKEDLSSIILRREDLLRIKYEGDEMGFSLDGIFLDEFLGYADLSKVVLKTECGFVAWVLNAGWIIVPELNGKPDWIHFEPLSDFLERSGVKLNNKKYNMQPYKERIMTMYLEEIEFHLEYINRIIHDEAACDPDGIILTIKDHRNRDVNSYEEIKQELENEIAVIKEYIMYCQSMKKWDFKILIEEYLKNQTVTAGK
jgi:hypothetical protein